MMTRQCLQSKIFVSYGCNLKSFFIKLNLFFSDGPAPEYQRQPIPDGMEGNQDIFPPSTIEHSEFSDEDSGNEGEFGDDELICASPTREEEETIGTRRKRIPDAEEVACQPPSKTFRIVGPDEEPEAVASSASSAQEGQVTHC